MPTTGSTHMELTPATQSEIIRDYLLDEGRRGKLLASLKRPMELLIADKALAPRIFQGVPEEDCTEVGEFELHCHPTMARDPENDWVYNNTLLFDRAVLMVESEISNQIAERTLSWLDAHAVETEAPFSEEAMDAVLKDTYLLNARNYSTLRKRMRDQLDPETSASALRLGIMGKYKDVPLIISRQVPVNTVYSVEKLGQVSITVDPQALIVSDTEVRLEVACKVLIRWKANPWVRRWKVSGETPVA